MSFFVEPVPVQSTPGAEVSAGRGSSVLQAGTVAGVCSGPGVPEAGEHI